MFAVIGLGNPGKEYFNSRHNTGFRVIDSMAVSLRVSLNQYACKSLFALTKQWLEENDIIYDALLMEDKKHLSIIAQIENAKFICEDNRYLCNVMGKFGFKVFLINSIYNQGELHSNVIRINKLNEIIEHLKT